MQNLFGFCDSFPVSASFFYLETSLIQKASRFKYFLDTEPLFNPESSLVQKALCYKRLYDSEASWGRSPSPLQNLFGAEGSLIHKASPVADLP
jgi:hypothetical protein